jgi:hypothetical protein
MSDDLVKMCKRLSQYAHAQLSSADLERIANRIEELEAKLAKAVEFTKGVIRHAGNSGDDYLAEQARTTLAELNSPMKGRNDEYAGKWED